VSKFAWVGLLAVLLAVTGCAAPDAGTHFTGVLFSLDEGEILLIEGLKSTDMSRAEALNLGKRAVIVQITGKTTIEVGGRKATPGDLKKGDTVRVWFDGPIRDSYPEQADGKKIVVP
jgi:hypothetical protein